MRYKKGLIDGVFGTGWQPSPIDLRDYNNRNDRVLAVSGALKQTASVNDERFSLRDEFEYPDDQESLGSCCGFSGCGVLEHLIWHMYGVRVKLSKRYLYKMLRYLLGWVGDTGGYLRATAAAMRAYGVCEESSWPYNIATFDERPPWEVGVLAMNNRVSSKKDSLTYFRHDAGMNTPPECVALSIREWIVKHVPTMFGTALFSDMQESDVRYTGKLPMPNARAYQIGGHAMSIIGWDDKCKIKNPVDGQIYTGAWEVRNSWGNYGDGGYLWIPYGYTLRKYMSDCWSIISTEFVDMDEFGL